MGWGLLVVGWTIVTAGIVFGHEGEQVPVRDADFGADNRVTPLGK